MLNYLKQEANRAYTENGAATYATSGSDCLDLFATIGALRGNDAQNIFKRFQRAYGEDPDLAMKILFYARDIRGGLGERKVFRTIARQMAFYAPESVEKNLGYVAEFGRWDDLMVFLDTPCENAAMALIRAQLASDLEALERGGNVSLMAKWLPSVNTSNADAVANAKRVARALGLSDAAYRKTLVKLREKIRIIENNLREMDYTFDYEKQPSKALFKYRKAFKRNDQERYEDFLNRVNRGEAKMNTGTLAPYEIIAPLIKGNAIDDLQAIDTTWNAQADFTGGENALVVVDGSGSMYWGTSDPTPAAVAISLAIYFAERNTGAFQNHFITFSRSPRLVEIKGKNIRDKVRYCMGYNEVANTNLSRVFDLILRTAVKNRLPQSQLPSTLYIISDMEFDCCAEGADVTNFEAAKRSFEKYGYELPRVVFWNVAARNEQQPVTMNEQGVALVSGNSPRIFSMLETGALDPMAYMLQILGAQRYEMICA